MPGFFACSNGCGRAYNTYATMSRHVRLDCGSERRFQCNQCQKYFKRKYHLKRHYTTHSKTVKIE
uniref:C2H2-type domain-containing protein n=1 Tax=Phlebotomus papatasi TaxID=29031 RepID=A0A1B0DK81_PHLPP